jgi:hypothetical protein
LLDKERLQHNVLVAGVLNNILMSPSRRMRVTLVCKVSLGNVFAGIGRKYIGHMGHT